MKTMKVWMAIVMMVAAGCAGVEVDPGEESDADSEVISGPADNTAQQAAQTADTDEVADESDAAPSDEAAALGADSADNDSADETGEANVSADDTADEQDDTDSVDSVDAAACTPDECGPGLLAPNVFCGDGSIGGPVCERDPAGQCGWDIRECPDGCTADACGPQTLRGRAANILCADGSMGGPVCGRQETRTCGWYYRSCPEECPSDECGDSPDYLQICANGKELHPVCTADDALDASTPSCSWKLPTCR